MSVPEPPTPTGRSVPAGEGEARDAGPAAAWTPWPRSPELPRRDSFGTRASAVLLAVCVPILGIELARVGESRVTQGQDGTYPVGHFLIVVGMVMLYVLPVALLIFAFRRRRRP